MITPPSLPVGEVPREYEVEQPSRRAVVQVRGDAVVCASPEMAENLRQFLSSGNWHGMDMGGRR